MLTIIEQKDLSGYRELLDQIGNTAGLHLTEAKENGEVKGYIAYAYEPEQVVIYAVEDGGDLNECDGLVRSVLFKGLLRGLERAEFRIQDSVMMARMRTLHFVQNNENILKNISEIMDNCRNCGEKPANT